MSSNKSHLPCQLSSKEFTKRKKQNKHAKLWFVFLLPDCFRRWKRVARASSLYWIGRQRRRRRRQDCRGDCAAGHATRPSLGCWPAIGRATAGPPPCAADATWTTSGKSPGRRRRPRRPARAARWRSFCIVAPCCVWWASSRPVVVGWTGALCLCWAAAASSRCCCWPLVVVVVVPSSGRSSQVMPSLCWTWLSCRDRIGAARTTMTTVRVARETLTTLFQEGGGGNLINSTQSISFFLLSYSPVNKARESYGGEMGIRRGSGSASYSE